MDKRIFIFLGFFGVSIVFLIFVISISLTVITPLEKILLLFVAFFLDSIAFATRFYSYLLMPIIKQRRRNLILNTDEAYWLSSSSDAIIHRDGEDFIATVFIKIPIYRSGTEMTNEEKLDFTNQISRIVSSSETPIRFTSQLHIMNKDDYINTLRSTANASELEEAGLLSRNATDLEIGRIRGKSSMWHHMLDNVSRTTSLELVNYASVSARGSKEFEAITAVQQKSRETMSGLAAVFGISPSIITGSAILRFVEPEFLIPYSTATEQITKSIREEVI
ncbi:MAG: hypothetical protein ACHQX1_03190 [Candidatus Micrarchaeales archaeon]